MTGRENTASLFMDSLSIGYSRGRNTLKLLPPLTASSEGGELIAVLGRNGIGKSTLLRTLAGLQPALGGNALIAGKNISEYSRSELAKKTGYISTEIIRVSNMRVRDLVALGRFPHTNWLGTINKDDREAIDNAIKNTGLENLQEKNISEISDGERQKTMIARVLAQDAGIMIMDEPTAFLDIAGKYEIINLLLNLAGEGKTIIISTHDFNIALSHADKIWLLLDDRLIEGAPEDLLLQGAFVHLFESTILRFNSGDGQFSLRKDSGKLICLKGKGPIRNWTEKALMRAGFELTENETDPYISIAGKNDEKWLLVSGSRYCSFSSLYDLARKLRE